MGTSPAIDLWTAGYRNDVATTLPLEVFTKRNVVADFFPCLKKVAIGAKQALLNITLGNTEFSEKYNLQKFEYSGSFVVIYSEYSQLTLAIMFADGWQPYVRKQLERNLAIGSSSF